MKHMETMLPMEDGVKLYTLTLLPEGEGPYSAVFARTPYDPAPSPELIGNVENTFRGYLARGFAVVWQHCRGRGGSLRSRLGCIYLLFRIRFIATGNQESSTKHETQHSFHFYPLF